MAAIEGERFFRRPPPMQSDNSRRNLNRFCKYHNEPGHATDECKSLKFFLRKLIQEGHLKEFLANPHQAGPSRPPVPPAQNRQQPPPAGGEELGNLNIIGHCLMFHEEGSPKPGKIQKLANSSSFTLTFQDQASPTSQDGTHSALVIQAIINRFLVSRILVDTGGTVNVLFKTLADKLNLQPEQLRPARGCLLGFAGERSKPVAATTLMVSLGDGGPVKPCVTKREDFLIVDAPSGYNAIFGRPLLNHFDVIISTRRLEMYFPSGAGTLVSRGSIPVAHECFATELRLHQSSRDLSADPRPSPLLPPRTEKGKEKAQIGPGQIIEVPAFPDSGSEKMLRVSQDHQGTFFAELTHLLQANADSFAWTPAEMPGINPEVICHRLNVKTDARPIKQKKRRYSDEIQAAIREEVTKLLEAGFIREIQYPDWVSNVVMVKKASGKWRMCVDFQCLNRACPKDDYPLPSIDALVDSATGYGYLSFLDAFSGYHQIRMDPSDQGKVSFITDDGVFCYQVMPFGLKNAGATYQRLMDKIFHDGKGKYLEVYVDDIVVKSKTAAEHLVHLQQMFRTLQGFGMKLNPLKCVFGASSGMFLGHHISAQGISANPGKIKAVLNITSPTSVKGVRNLTGQLAGLSRFISKFGEKCAPFFRTLRKDQLFHWDADCQEALEGIKAYLTTAPILSSPGPGEVLLLYLGTCTSAVSSVLVREEARLQKPVYYVSHSLHGPELNYPKMDKLALAMVISARRLRPYFQAHKVRVVTDSPLRVCLQKPEVSGRLLKWSIELSEFDLEFVPRTAIKAQALADFVAEFSSTESDDSASEESPVSDSGGGPSTSWQMFVDGASGTNSQGIGVVLISPSGVHIKKSVLINFEVTNNQAEYEALLAGLRLALGLEVTDLIIRSDSQLMVNQLEGSYQVKDPLLSRYRDLALSHLKQLRHHELIHIPRDQNASADHLAKYGAPHTSNLLQLEAPSIDSDAPEVCTVDEAPGRWADPILRFLQQGILPSQKAEALKLRREAARYFLADGLLYKKSHFGISLRCIAPPSTLDVLEEIHSGDCGSHSAGATLAQKVLRQGYYWPTLQKDAEEFAKKCVACQTHGNILRQPAQPLQPIAAPWPFALWGMDFVGPLPQGKGQKKFLLVLVDYFTKWVEVKAMTRAISESVISFLWSEIFSRFGLPMGIITDNGSQFNNPKMIDFCSRNGVDLKFASVAHPQTNGQAEAANKSIIKLLKKKLQDKGSNWVDELPSVLWAHRTTPSTSTGETPFSLAFGTEAVTPVELIVPTARTLPPASWEPEKVSQWMEHNTEGLQMQLELLPELRSVAERRVRLQKARLTRFLAKRFRPRIFNSGDLVLRKLEAAGQSEFPGKFAPNWDGPYLIKESRGPGSYILQTSEGEILPHTWNAVDLKAFYA